MLSRAQPASKGVSKELTSSPSMGEDSGEGEPRCAGPNCSARDVPKGAIRSLFSPFDKCHFLTYTQNKKVHTDLACRRWKKLNRSCFLILD